MSIDFGTVQLCVQIYSDVRVQVIDWEIESLTFSSDESRNELGNFESGDPNAVPVSKNNIATHEDVCATPKALLREVLTVLDVLGPWCAYMCRSSRLLLVYYSLYITFIQFYESASPIAAFTANTLRAKL